MASGRTHDIINLSVFPVAVYYLKPESFSGFFFGYMVGTFFLSPDNDLFHSKPNKRWKALRFIWLPYTKLFSHRGISHIPFLGMITKLLYISAVVFIAFLLFYLAFFLAGINIHFSDKVSVEEFKRFFFSPFSVSTFIGLFLSEIVHIITDVIYSALKRFPLTRKLFLR